MSKLLEQRHPLPPFNFESAAEKVQLAYEYQDTQGNWFRAYGNENWAFNEDGYMHTRIASINEHAIDESERKLIWDEKLKPRNYPRLTSLGL